MIDDLVKRLRDMCGDDGILAIRDIYDHDVAEAADRIEKLEALVEQLRDDNSSIMDSFDEDFLRQDDRIEKLEAALQEIVEQEPKTAHPVVVHIVAIARKALEGKND